MMEYSLREITEITGGRLLYGDPEALVHHVTFDSRSMQGDDLFVPVIGERTDGHRFIKSAFAAGASASLTSRADAAPEEEREITASDPASCGHGCILVEDTVAALQQLGRYRREHELKMPFVGITGSVGKTTTREMTMTALSAAGTVTGSLKNMNSQLGVPVTLCHMDETADYAVAEMGISIPGEMDRLAFMVQPELAIVTNIGVAHIETLGSREGICREKMKITDRLPESGFAVLNADEPLLLAYKEQKRFRTLYYGLGPDAEVTASDIIYGDGVSFTAHLPEWLAGAKKEIPVRLSVPGEHHVMDALAALSAAAILGAAPEEAAWALASFGGFTRRWERVNIGKMLLIDDSYNANPVSMQASLVSFAGLQADRKIAVIADMLELGPDGPAMHRETGRFAAALPIDIFITLGDSMTEADRELTKAGKTVRHAATADEAADAVREYASGSCAVLLKGSHSMGLDRVRERLQQC